MKEGAKVLGDADGLGRCRLLCVVRQHYIEMTCTGFGVQIPVLPLTNCAA